MVSMSRQMLEIDIDFIEKNKETMKSPSPQNKTKQK